MVIDAYLPAANSRDGLNDTRDRLYQSKDERENERRNRNPKYVYRWFGLLLSNNNHCRIAVGSVLSYSSFNASNCGPQYLYWLMFRGAGGILPASRSRFSFLCIRRTHFLQARWDAGNRRANVCAVSSRNPGGKI